MYYISAVPSYTGEYTEGFMKSDIKLSWRFNRTRPRYARFGNGHQSDGNGHQSDGNDNRFEFFKKDDTLRTCMVNSF